MDQRVFKRPWFSDDTWGVPPDLAPGPQQIRSLRKRGFERYGFAEMALLQRKGLVGLRRKELVEITPEGYKRPQRDRTLSEEGLKIK